MLKPAHAIAVLALLTSAAALAHGGATGIVKDRMEAMKSLGAAGKALAAMARKETPFDPVAAASHAETMAGHGGEAMTRLFPEDSLDSPTEALPVIWDEWERFSDLAGDLETSALALKTIAEAGDFDAFRPAFAKVAGTCGDCHEDFRKEK